MWLLPRASGQSRRFRSRQDSRATCSSPRWFHSSQKDCSKARWGRLGLRSWARRCFRGLYRRRHRFRFRYRSQRWSGSRCRSSRWWFRSILQESHQYICYHIYVTYNMPRSLDIPYWEQQRPAAQDAPPFVGPQRFGSVFGGGGGGVVPVQVFPIG